MSIKNFAEIPLSKQRRFQLPSFPVTPPRWLKTIPYMDYANKVRLINECIPKYFGIVYLLILIMFGAALYLFFGTLMPYLFLETLYLFYSFLAVRRAKLKIKQLQDSWTTMDLVWKIDVSFSFFLNMYGTLTLIEYNQSSPDTVQIKIRNSFDKISFDKARKYDNV